MEKKILVVDDDETLVEMLETALRSKGYQVFSCTRGSEALKLAYQVHPDLIILDVLMPDMTGFETLQRLREMSDLPVIVLSAKTQNEDVIHGLVIGADDYVRKPFSVDELLERVRTVLKRSEQSKGTDSGFYRDECLLIDMAHNRVQRRGQTVHLTPTETRLLGSLVRQQGQVLLHNELAREVWGDENMEAAIALPIYIRYLREKLEDEPSNPRYIRTQWGKGYWFAPANSAGATA